MQFCKIYITPVQIGETEREKESLSGSCSMNECDLHELEMCNLAFFSSFNWLHLFVVGNKVHLVDVILTCLQGWQHP